MTKPKDIRRGDPITADFLNRSKNAGVHDVRGAGVTQSGGRVVIGQVNPGPPARSYDVKKKVILTARTSTEGEFEFAEVEWNKSSGKFQVKTGGVTHTDLGPARATSDQIEGGAGLVYVGDIVTIRPGLKDRGLSYAKVGWEFTPAAKVMPVDVTQIGGTQGTDSSPATWTYDVYAKDGEKLLSAVSPLNQRPPTGEVTAGTGGYAHYNLVAGVPTFTLGLINEIDPGVGGAGDGQGYEAIRHNNAAVDAETDGGIHDFDDQQTPATGRLKVEWDLTGDLDGGGGDTKRTRIRGEVDPSGMTPEDIGGSSSVHHRAEIASTDTAKLVTVDADDYSGRQIFFALVSHNGTEASWNALSGGGPPTSAFKVGLNEVNDIILGGTPGSGYIIDVSDGYKLKLNIVTPPGSDSDWMQIFVVKGPRKIANDYPAP